MDISDRVKQFAQKMREFRTIRERCVEEIQNKVQHNTILKFSKSIWQEKLLVENLRDQFADKMILQLSQRKQFYQFQLQKIFQYIKSYVRSDSIRKKYSEPLRKIAKKAQKFLTSQYDFTLHQIMGLLLYSQSFDRNVLVPVDEDFRMFYRIIKKLTDFNHYDYAYMLVFEQLVIFLIALEVNSRRSNVFQDMRKKIQMMEKYQIVEFNIQAIMLNLDNESLLTYLYTMDINLTIVGSFSRKFDNRISQKPIIYTLEEQDLKILDGLTKKFIDFAPFILRQMTIHDDIRIFEVGVSFIAQISNFQEYSLKDQKFFNFNNSMDLEIIPQKIELSSSQKFLVNILRQNNIIDLIASKQQAWIKSQDYIDDVFTILEFITTQISVPKFKEKLIPIVEFSLFQQKISPKFDWIIKFVHLNKKPENVQLFRQIFVQSQVLSKLLEKLENVGQKLEENVTCNLDGNYGPSDARNFVLGTILAIEICKVCEMNPFKVILISAEIVLKLKFNCYWLNDLMEKFLKQNPFVPNEKMEIEE